MEDFGSKKKKKRAEFEARKLNREKERKEIENYNRIMNDENTTMEELAAVMGVKLK